MAKIALFGLAGTGTSTVGRLLAERLGYQFMYSGQIFRDLAKEKGLDLYQFETYVNDHPEVDRELDRRIAKFGQEHDNFIFDSRLAWYFIPDSIKIKLDCDFAERTARVAERDQMELEEVRQKTIFRESAGGKRYVETYGLIDYDADQHFDLVLDTTKTAPEAIVNQLVDYLASQGLLPGDII